MFRRVERGDATLVVAEEFEEDARQLGLPDPARLDALLAGGEPMGGRGRSARVELPSGRRLVLRAVRHGGLLGPLRRGALLGIARPLAELEVTAALRAAGAPVPLPVLVAGARRTGPLWSAALGTLFEEGAVDALRFLTAEPPRDEVLRAAEALGRAVRRFHDAGGRHRDLHLENLLLRDGDAIVIDLDRARRIESVSPGRRMAELMRLYRSLQKRRLLETAGPRGCARFFSAYVAGDRDLRRALRARLPWERVLLAVHSLHY